MRVTFELRQWRENAKRAIRCCAIASGVLVVLGWLSGTSAQDPAPIMQVELPWNSPIRSMPQWIEFLPDDKRLAVRYSETQFSEAAVLTVMDAATGESVVSTRIKGGATFSDGFSRRCGISPKGDWIVYASEGAAVFFDIPQSPKITKVEKVERPTFNFGLMGARDQIWISADGKSGWAVAGGLEIEQYYARRIEHPKWPPSDPQIVRKIARQSEIVSALTANMSSLKLAVSIHNYDTPPKAIIELWTLDEKPKKTVVKQHRGAKSLAFSNDGTTLAAAYDDGSIAWWDVKTEKLIVHSEKVTPWTVMSVAIHPSGKYLACGAIGRKGNNLFLIERTTGRVFREFEADSQSVNLLCFDSTGGKLATFGWSGVVKIWNTNDLLMPRKP